jgi:hypothetical protein
VIKSRRMRWVGHVACMSVMTNAYISVGKPEAEATCETYAANGRIKLR